MGFGRKHAMLKPFKKHKIQNDGRIEEFKSPVCPKNASSTYFIIERMWLCFANHFIQIFFYWWLVQHLSNNYYIETFVFTRKTRSPNWLKMFYVVLIVKIFVMMKNITLKLSSPALALCFGVVISFFFLFLCGFKNLKCVDVDRSKRMN